MRMAAIGITALIIILVLAGIAYYAIGGNQKPEPTITVATIQFGISTLDLIQEGVVKPYGINVKAMRIQLAPDVATALLKGDAQVAILPVDVAAKLFEAGKDITIIAVDMYQNQAILVPVNSSIKDPSMLKGRTVASPIASGTFAMFKSYMKALYNLTVLNPGEQGDGVMVVNTPPAQALDAVAKGDADAAVVWEPIVSQALASGKYKIIASFQDMWGRIGYPGKPVMIVWVARGDWVRSHPEQVEKLLEARREAALAWTGNRAATINALEKLYGLQGKVLNILYNRTLICTDKTITPELQDSIRHVLHLAMLGGYIETDQINYNEFIYVPQGNS
ncbi:MAG: ABC transporter substrate-binding protein [Desulfurococcales archaeon]|nr:ABC transporter substrate-binding protein [Desulfurococcales archaeon]